MEKKSRLLSSHPKSFFELVIAGFSLVAVPLTAALISGAFYLGRLSDQSQEAVYRAVQATQASRVLLEQITTMERNVRQYFVLGDELLLDNYRERHQIYLETAEKLGQLLVDDTMKVTLEMLNQREMELFDRLNSQADVATKQIEKEFISLTEMAQSILQNTNQLIDSEVEILHDMSQQARQIIFWELAAVIPGALIFIVVFTVLISRPIRQIDHSIRRLGDGNFDKPISVTGPKDLEYLGERLDWLRERLHQLEEKKHKFLRYVSHELKTPLTAIRESAELLDEEVTGPMTPEQHEVTDILKNNSISLQTMIEKLLSFNMPEARELSSEYGPIRLRQLIDNVVADHKPAIMAKGVELEMGIPDLTIYGDPEQMRVVVDNLLSNAVKYSPEHGHIRVNVHRDDDHVTLEVQDSGPGIDPADKEHIFDAFYQGRRRVAKGHIRGSGLGLSIAREFVQAHRGDIEVVEEGTGAHFRVTLPAEQEKDVTWVAS